MGIEVPAQIVLQGVAHHIHHIGTHQCHMMLKGIATDVLEQLLQIVHLGHSDTSIHSIRIAGNLSLAKLCLDDALWIVGRDAEEGERTLRHLGIHRSKGAHLAQCSSQHAQGT